MPAILRLSVPWDRDRGGNDPRRKARRVPRSFARLFPRGAKRKKKEREKEKKCEADEKESPSASLSLRRGLIYSRCNFQYFSADRDRRGCINPRVGALLPPGGIAGQRPGQLLGVPRLFHAVKQPRRMRARGMIDSPKGRKKPPALLSRIYACMRMRTQ